MIWIKKMLLLQSHTHPTTLSFPPQETDTHVPQHEAIVLLDQVATRLRHTPLNDQRTAEFQYEVGKDLRSLTQQLTNMSAAQQSQAAQLIGFNLPYLREEERSAIKAYCTQALQTEEPILAHYEGALTSILNRKNPTLFEHLNTHITQPDTEDAPISTTTHSSHILPFKAVYQRGKKIRLFENKAWRDLKTQIKNAYVSTQWENFINGTTANDGQNHLKTQMYALLDERAQPTKLHTKAEKYINKKIEKSLYVLDAQGVGVFRSKGTNLDSRVYRAGPDKFYRLLGHVSKHTREAIKQQQGVHAKNRVFLGSGATATVQLAEQFTEGNRTLVAAKISSETRMLKNEHKMLQTLHTPNNTEYAHYFSTINDLVANPKTPKAPAQQTILFMDLHVRGTLHSVMHQLGKISQQADREKGAQTIAKQLVQAVLSMHTQGISHRDIKPDNFLFSQKGHIVVSDLGTATPAKAINGGTTGTEGYWAPEELNETANRKPDLADRYALGQVLFNLLEAAHIRKNHPLRAMSNALIHPDPNLRPDLAAILNRISNETYTNKELLHMVDTGKAPQRASPNTATNASMA